MHNIFFLVAVGLVGVLAAPTPRTRALNSKLELSIRRPPSDSSDYTLVRRAVVNLKDGRPRRPGHYITRELPLVTLLNLFSYFMQPRVVPMTVLSLTSSQLPALWINISSNGMRV
jgi:hypothetical protein